MYNTLSTNKMTTFSTIDTKAIFYSTLRISVIVQIITGIIEIITLFFTLKTPPQYYIINHLVYLELAVQVIEGLFYIWLVYNFNKVTNVTPKRYVDWAITTPLMLITLSAFLKHNGNNSTNLRDFLVNHKGSIIKIVLLNASMLAFGLIGEFGYLTPLLSTALGFIPFTLNFKYIKDTFLVSSHDDIKKYLFYWFVCIWGRYGIFALMNYTNKNTGYNILDIFSKNFFGIFLAYIVWSKAKKE